MKLQKTKPPSLVLMELTYIRLDCNWYGNKKQITIAHLCYNILMCCSRQNIERGSIPDIFLP